MNKMEINIIYETEDIYNTISGRKWTKSEDEIKSVIDDLERLKKEFIKYYAIELAK